MKTRADSDRWTAPSAAATLVSSSAFSAKALNSVSFHSLSIFLYINSCDIIQILNIGASSLPQRRKQTTMLTSVIYDLQNSKHRVLCHRAGNVGNGCRQTGHHGSSAQQTHGRWKRSLQGLTSVIATKCCVFNFIC